MFLGPRLIDLVCLTVIAAIIGSSYIQEYRYHNTTPSEVKQFHTTMARKLRQAENSDFFELIDNRIGIVVMQKPKFDAIFFKLHPHDKVRKMSCFKLGKLTKRIIQKDTDEWHDMAGLFLRH
ncbi:MAG: hypothetical protein K8Q97_00715 [Candidatus Andersenbacteria bacterium]|nr:hypothetical protein [Candidatus Andersenbacteria bacterium]